MKKSRLLGAMCACAIISIPTLTNAEIISADWQTAGDNLITRDTVSGLDWLDLTVTSNISYNEMSSKLGTGQEFDGWRFASEAEIIAFFEAFGTGWEPLYNNDPTGLFDLVAPLWGDLWCANQGCAIGDGISDFMWGQPLQTGGCCPIPRGTIADNIAAPYSSPVEIDLKDPQFASALVRQTIPIPPALWLFGSGLLGLIGVARKKAA